MKKAAIFLLAMMYLAVTSGVMVNVHYCMGDLTSVKYGVDKDGLCDKCGMPQKKGCCHTEHKLVKADDPHILAAGHQLLVPFEAELPSDNHSAVVSRYAYRDHYYPQYHSPPDIYPPSVYLVNCVFRI